MTGPRAQMQALEKLRAIETDISLRVHVLRRWIRADLDQAWRSYGFEGTPPNFPYADRIELWWHTPQGGEGQPAIDRPTFDRIKILAEWLVEFDSAIADRALLASRPDGKSVKVERYRPGNGDGTPLLPVLEKIFLNLWTAQALREEAGVEPI